MPQFDTECRPLSALLLALLLLLLPPLLMYAATARVSPSATAGHFGLTPLLLLRL
jgi:hypothetical protein